MTIEEHQKFLEGKELWYEYIRVNGYAFQPNDKGLRKLSKWLDLKKSYIQKLINLYLEA